MGEKGGGGRKKKKKKGRRGLGCEGGLCMLDGNGEAGLDYIGWMPRQYDQGSRRRRRRRRSDIKRRWLM
jgi:hypothetical protein